MGNLAIKRKMRAGPNYDLVTGTNLLGSNEVAAMWLYIKNGKPKIAVLEPRCTPFGSFGSYNKRGSLRLLACELQRVCTSGSTVRSDCNSSTATGPRLRG